MPTEAASERWEELKRMLPAKRHDAGAERSERDAASLSFSSCSFSPTPTITGGEHARTQGACVFDVRVDGVVRHALLL